MKKQFLGYSTKSWLIFSIAVFIYAPLMVWFTDFITYLININDK